MIKRILAIVFLMACCIPVTHVLFYYIVVWVSNIASPTQATLTPYDTAWQTYRTTLLQVLSNSYLFPGTEVPLLSHLRELSVRSLGLLSIAASIAILCGISVGMYVSRHLHTEFPRWFIVMTSSGNALQSLFIASSGVALMYFIIVYTPYQPPLPLHGFGWDTHVVLPVLALSIRPMMSIALETATLFGQASQEPHVTATQARGFSKTHILLAHLWPGQAQTIGLICTSNIRQMIAELMVIEMIFGWGGLGEHIVRTIVPPKLTNIAPVAVYLDAQTFAWLGIVIVMIFSLIELLRIVTTPRHLWSINTDSV